MRTPRAGAASRRALLGLEPGGFLETGQVLEHFASSRDAARVRYRTFCAEDGRQERSLHPLVDGDDAFVRGTLESVVAAPGIPRRYLAAPRARLDALLVSDDIEAIAAYETGYESPW